MDIDVVGIQSVQGVSKSACGQATSGSYAHGLLAIIDADSLLSGVLDSRVIGSEATGISRQLNLIKGKQSQPGPRRGEMVYLTQRRRREGYNSVAVRHRAPKAVSLWSLDKHGHSPRSGCSLVVGFADTLLFLRDPPRRLGV